MQIKYLNQASIEITKSFTKSMAAANKSIAAIAAGRGNNQQR
jgi:hypothetical protein